MVFITLTLTAVMWVRWRRRSILLLMGIAAAGSLLFTGVGKKVVVVVESLRPIKGEVRWYSDRRAGIVFDKPLDFDELTEWVGKRLELASLKASYQKG